MGRSVCAGRGSEAPDAGALEAALFVADDAAATAPPPPLTETAGEAFAALLPDPLTTDLAPAAPTTAFAAMGFASEDLGVAAFVWVAVFPCVAVVLGVAILDVTAWVPGALLVAALLVAAFVVTALVATALPAVFATLFAAAFAKIAFDTLSLFDGRSLRARSQRRSPTAKEPSII